MAGAGTHVSYVDDTTVAYRLRIPAWVSTLCGSTAATTQPNKPTGLRPRKRYYRVTATGKEGSFHVPDVTSTMWTDPVGTAVTIEAGTFGATGLAATLQGRTGERLKAI
jgi:hypothetical protein